MSLISPITESNRKGMFSLTTETTQQLGAQAGATRTTEPPRAWLASASAVWSERLGRTGRIDERQIVLMGIGNQGVHQFGRPLVRRVEMLNDRVEMYFLTVRSRSWPLSPPVRIMALYRSSFGVTITKRLRCSTFLFKLSRFVGFRGDIAAKSVRDSVRPVPTIRRFAHGQQTSRRQGARGRSARRWNASPPIPRSSASRRWRAPSTARAHMAAEDADPKTRSRFGAGAPAARSRSIVFIVLAVWLVGYLRR
jgi:hypothetical protein